MTERCEVCGFAWDEVPAGEVGPRILTAADRIVAALARAGDAVGTRPQPATWSALEYAGHVRDVLLHVRDRVVIALVEDDPEFKPLYRDHRVDLGLYRDDEPATTRTELSLAAGLFARTFAVLSADQLARPCQYAYPTVSRRSILWMGQQVVHELEHHAGDVDTVLSATSTPACP